MRPLASRPLQIAHIHLTSRAADRQALGQLQAALRPIFGSVSSGGYWGSDGLLVRAAGLWLSAQTRQLTLILRGFAFSAFGKTSVITPFVSSAVIPSCSILLEI